MNQTNSTARIDAGPDRSHRRAVLRADLGQRLRGAGHAAIAREGEEHARGRGHRREAAEPLRDEDRQVEQDLDGRVHLAVHGPEEHVPALLGRFVHVRDHQHEGAKHDPAEQRRPEHRRDHAARHGGRGLHRFFRSMRRGVIAGDRVDRQQQAEQERHQARHCDRPDAACALGAGVVGEGHTAARSPSVGAEIRQTMVSATAVAKIR